MGTFRGESGAESGIESKPMAAITIELPDAIVKELGGTPVEITRRVLEAIILEGYRSERLSRGAVRQLLEMTWHETEEFLAGHGLLYHYTVDDLNEDRENLDKLLGRL